jgi:hypothetical protein
LNRFSRSPTEPILKLSNNHQETTNNKHSKANVEQRYFLCGGAKIKTINAITDSINNKNKKNEDDDNNKNSIKKKLRIDSLTDITDKDNNNKPRKRTLSRKSSSDSNHQNTNLKVGKLRLTRHRLLRNNSLR